MRKLLKISILSFLLISANLLLAQTKKEHKAFKKAAIKLVENWQTAGPEFDYEKAETFTPEVGIRGKYYLNKNIVNLLSIAKIVGEPVFISGPHKKEMNFRSNEFGQYNPKFLQKLNALLTNLLNDKKFKEMSSALYDREFKKYLQTMMHAYEYVLENEENKTAAIENYKNFISIDPSSASFNMQEHFRDFSDYFAENGYDWYELSTAAVFWTRRAMDNSDKEFFNLLTTVIESYNRSFMERQ
jgi:hypothetical protein